jgi:lysine 2,3-aminomutase
MPSGHDTLNAQTSIDDKISESYATISTWDNKKIYRYEALGRSTRKEFEESVRIMDQFIGRKGVFLPKVIIVDTEGNHLETTNRTRLPVFERSKKSELLDYELFDDQMPLTNPADIAERLEESYIKSTFNNPKANIDIPL